MNKSSRRMKCKQTESPQHSENNGHNKEHKIPFPLSPAPPAAGSAEPRLSRTRLRTVVLQRQIHGDGVAFLDALKGFRGKGHDHRSLGGLEMNPPLLRFNARHLTLHGMPTHHWIRST